MGMIGLKLANQSFSACVAKIIRKYTSYSISDIKLKVQKEEYVFECDYIDSEGINTIIKIYKEMKENGIDCVIYEHDEITTIDFLHNLLLSYEETERQVEEEIEDEVLRENNI
jgi:hypothetical protein